MYARTKEIIDSGELHLPVVYHSIQLCYEALSAMRGEDPREGANWQRALEYADKADRAFDSVRFHYDTGDDAVPDTTVSFSSVRAQRR